MSTTYQVMPALAPDIYAALKADIRKRSVLLLVDQIKLGVQGGLGFSVE